VGYAKLVRHGFGEDGWIWISNRFAEGYPTRFFMSGWHGALDYVIWNRDKKCLLMLPLPEEPSSRGSAVQLQLHLTLPETSASNPISIGIRVDDGPIKNFHLSTEDEILTVLMSTASSQFRGVSQVELHLNAAPRGGESALADLNMRMGVRRFRYRLLSSEDEQTFVGPSGAGVSDCAPKNQLYAVVDGKLGDNGLSVRSKSA
jgi:hypothetical protein